MKERAPRNERKLQAERDRRNMPKSAPEIVPIGLRPIWAPTKDRAYRTMLEKIDASKTTLSLGRKQYE